LKVIETQKERAAQFDDESVLIDAYVAWGGEPDKSGHVDAEVLIKVGLSNGCRAVCRAVCRTSGAG
jgi:hypothetical protein